MITSVFTGKTNAALIAYIAPLWFPDPTLHWCDVTYGRGKWWSIWRPTHLIAHDIALDGTDFRDLPEPGGTYDVVAYDPPYISIGSLATSSLPDFHYRYGTGHIRGADNLIAYNLDGLREVYRVLKPGGRALMKCADWVESNRFVPGHLYMLTGALRLGFEVLDEVVHYSGTGPQPTLNPDGTPRRQVHTRRAHSFLVLLGKGTQTSVPQVRDLSAASAALSPAAGGPSLLVSVGFPSNVLS